MGQAPSARARQMRSRWNAAAVGHCSTHFGVLDGEKHKAMRIFLQQRLRVNFLGGLRILRKGEPRIIIIQTPGSWDWRGGTDGVARPAEHKPLSLSLLHDDLHLLHTSFPQHQRRHQQLRGSKNSWRFQKLLCRFARLHRNGQEMPQDATVREELAAAVESFHIRGLRRATEWCVCVCFWCLGRAYHLDFFRTMSPATPQRFQKTGE